MFSKLKKGGNLTIGLPTDPGVMWRIGKFISANFLIKKVIIIQKMIITILQQKIM